MEEQKLRRAFFRGYRQGDVELELARNSLKREQLQMEVEALRARTNAMQTEITDLHRRIDDFRRREHELTAELQDERVRREALESRAHGIVVDAEQRAAAIRTQALVHVGELQQQVEQLLGQRAGLSAALKRVTRDIADSLDRLEAAPARAIDHPPPLARPSEQVEEIDDRFLR